MKPETKDLPVFVDKAGSAPDQGMTRLVYFYIQCAEPHDVGLLEEAGTLPVFMLDLEAVITGGLGDRRHLDTPEVIQELFDFIEGQTPYVVGTGYFWLPTEFLQRCAGRTPVRGDVLRVATALFAYVSARDRRTRPVTTGELPSGEQGVYFSAEETRAFSEWTDRTVERVRKRYYEQPQRNLRQRF